MKADKLIKLAYSRNNPSVTITLNTHRTHPDNLQDEILLKKLLKQAEKYLISEYDKREIAPLLQKVNALAGKINRNYNLDSMHIFLSNDVEEVIRLPYSTMGNTVEIRDSFNIRPLIRAYNRTEEYLILLLSQGGTFLYRAINDKIVDEINSEGFPFAANPHIVTDTEKRSDAALMDNMVKEYFNKVDKALVKICNETDLLCLVICTEDNFSRLMQVADKKKKYLGYAPVNYNDTSVSTLAKQGYKAINDYQYNIRTKAIEEMEDAISHGNVLTDLQEIYQAAIAGKGDLLIISNDFVQPVVMTGEKTFDVVTDKNTPGIIDDIIGTIAWEVLSKNGRVFFTVQEQLKKIGEIALKVRS
ncbi:MAG: hypothetical protein LBP67_02780 [Bacteroidales bacterium]|jgi:hypothetical protein|nr:hypothetical protein [Bacteroidales bacterium]